MQAARSYRCKDSAACTIVTTSLLEVRYGSFSNRLNAPRAVCLPPNRNVSDGLLPAHNQFPTTLNSSFGRLAWQICPCLNGYTQVIWFPDRILAKHRYVNPSHRKALI